MQLSMAFGDLMCAIRDCDATILLAEAVHASELADMAAMDYKLLCESGENYDNARKTVVYESAPDEKKAAVFDRLKAAVVKVVRKVVKFFKELKLKIMSAVTKLGKKGDAPETVQVPAKEVEKLHLFKLIKGKLKEFCSIVHSGLFHKVIPFLKRSAEWVGHLMALGIDGLKRGVSGLVAKFSKKKEASGTIEMKVDDVVEAQEEIEKEIVEPLDSAADALENTTFEEVKADCEKATEEGDSGEKIEPNQTMTTISIIINGTASAAQETATNLASAVVKQAA